MEYFPLFQPLWKRLPRRLHHTCTVAMQQVGLPSFKIDLHVLIGLLTTKKATSTAATASFQHHHHLALYKATIWFVFTEGFSINRILGATDETSFNNTCCWLASRSCYEGVSEIEVIRHDSFWGNNFTNNHVSSYNNSMTTMTTLNTKKIVTCHSLFHWRFRNNDATEFSSSLFYNRPDQLGLPRRPCFKGSLRGYGGQAHCCCSWLPCTY